MTAFPSVHFFTIHTDTVFFLILLFLQNYASIISLALLLFLPTEQSVKESKKSGLQYLWQSQKGTIWSETIISLIYLLLTQLLRCTLHCCRTQVRKIRGRISLRLLEANVGST